MKKQKRNILISILVILIIVILFSLWKILIWLKDNYETKKELNYIKSIVKIENNNDIANTELYCKDNCPDFKLLNVNFEDLKLQNNELSGWLEVPNTNINYPFVQHDDNSYYLTHSFDKKRSEAGWVFLDYRNDKNFYDTNSIIYAHGRLDGTMFGTLKQVFEQEWLNNKANHIIRVVTEKYNLIYQVFSVYHIKTTDDYITTGFKSDKDYEKFLNMIKDRSIYDFGYIVNNNDRILTLSTCYNNWEKVVVHAKLIARQFK